jgi:hypothetical protein
MLNILSHVVLGEKGCGHHKVAVAKIACRAPLSFRRAKWIGSALASLSSMFKYKSTRALMCVCAPPAYGLGRVQRAAGNGPRLPNCPAAARSLARHPPLLNHVPSLLKEIIKIMASIALYSALDQSPQPQQSTRATEAIYMFWGPLHFKKGCCNKFLSLPERATVVEICWILIKRPGDILRPNRISLVIHHRMCMYTFIRTRIGAGKRLFLRFHNSL